MTIVNATLMIRKMRGGSQAHLLHCDDRNYYVVKFLNNPQHRRILINEWIASTLLDHLQISGPPTAIVVLTQDFLDRNPEVHIQHGTRRVAVEPGRHFGSRYPGEPGSVMVYDFLPDTLLARVKNIHEFLGVLAFDKWTGNADTRQSIFLSCARDTSKGLTRRGYKAQMLDHGYVFSGPHWTFMDSPLQGLYFRPDVYRDVTSFQDFEPWLGRVMRFPEEVIHRAVATLPEEWLSGDAALLQTVLGRLMSRRKRVPDLVRDCRLARVNPFPNWGSDQALPYSRLGADYLNKIGEHN